MKYVAQQVKVDRTLLAAYDWSGRAIKYVGAQIREAFAFRESTRGDEQTMTAWFVDEVCPVELNEGHLDRPGPSSSNGSAVVASRLSAESLRRLDEVAAEVTPWSLAPCSTGSCTVPWCPTSRDRVGRMREHDALETAINRASRRRPQGADSAGPCLRTLIVAIHDHRSRRAIALVSRGSSVSNGSVFGLLFHGRVSFYVPLTQQPFLRAAVMGRPALG